MALEVFLVNDWAVKHRGCGDIRMATAKTAEYGAHGAKRRSRILAGSVKVTPAEILSASCTYHRFGNVFLTPLKWTSIPRYLQCCISAKGGVPVAAHQPAAADLRERQKDLRRSKPQAVATAALIQRRLPVASQLACSSVAGNE